MMTSSESHLMRLAETMINVNPALSRQYMSLVLERQDDEEPKSPAEDLTKSCCPYCGSIYLPDNYTTRILPKMKLGKTLHKLLMRQAQGPTVITKYQKKLITRYRKSSARLSIYCHICQKNNNISGESREEAAKNTACVKRTADANQILKSMRGRQQQIDRNTKKQKIQARRQRTEKKKENKKERKKKWKEKLKSINKLVSTNVQITEPVSSRTKKTGDMTKTGDSQAVLKSDKNIVNSLTSITVSNSLTEELSRKLPVKAKNVVNNFTGQRPLTSKPQSVKSLLTSNNTKSSEELPVNKKKKSALVHTQLQQIFAMDVQRGEGGVGSLKDFLSSL